LTFNQASLTTGAIMADFNKKWADNQPGRFYVDDQCIDCDACRTEAPDNFTRNDEHGYSYVYKQPSSPEEEARCKAAAEACPVEAIGQDGK
jgi:ferredoxin